MGGPVEVAGDQLRAIIERIEHIEGEISELNEAKKEIYQEAKSNGFDVKVLREVVQLRKQDQKEREEHESLLEVYLRAIKGARAPRRLNSASATSAAGRPAVAPDSFEAAIKGAFYAEEMQAMLAEGRLSDYRQM
jgi:uncharacterized protein (UPF0335 family)